MAKMNLNAVTLVRVSTKKQGDEDRFGMESQRRYNAAVVAANNFVVRMAVDYKDVSGDAVMHTPEMRELQALLHTPEMKYGHLVAKELSRLLRPNYTDYPLLQVFADQQITIHLPHHELQLWTPSGRMLAGVLCAVDFNEAERIRDRCMAGREEARRRGYCAAGGRTLPSGALWDVKTKTHSFDNEYFPKMVEAFRMVGSGETNFSYIIRTLNLCLRPGRGEPKLATPTDLRRLLQNRMYIGQRVTDKKRDLTVPTNQLTYIGRDNKLHRKNRPVIAREPHETYVMQVITPGLGVSEALFEKVQTILRAKSDKFRQNHALHSDRPKFAYRGLLVCADCGQPIYTVTTGDPAGGYYRCRDRFERRGRRQHCKAPTMKRVKLETELDRIFSQQFPQTHFLADILSKHLGSDDRQNTARQRERLVKQAGVLAGKRLRIIELVVDGTITKADCDRRLKLVDDDLAVNHRTLNELQDRPLPTYKEWCDLMRPFRNFQGLTPDEKRKLITSHFQEIRVKDYRIVSLYLLTGEVATVNTEASPQVDPNTCYSCGRRIRLPKDPLHREAYCGPCSDGISQLEAGQQVPGAILAPPPAFDDTYQRL